MLVKIIKSGKFASSPRDVISINAGDVVALGFQGLTEANLKRLIELGFAKEVENIELPATPAELPIEAQEEEVDTEVPVEIEKAVVDLDSLETKKAVLAYAEEFLGVQLDRKKSVEALKQEIKDIQGV